MNKYLMLMRFDKPIGIYLLAYPVVWSLLLVKTTDIKIWIIFILGTIIMRAAGCVINDLADKNFDKFVARTSTRPLVANNSISTKNALALFIVLLIFALILLLQTNLLTIKIALLAAVLTIIYPFTKRFFAVPQLFLAVAFALSVPMSFAASVGSVPWYSWCVFIATIFWVMSYDTIYAMVDKEDDLKIKIKSSAIFFGKWDKIAVMIFQLMTLLALIIVGVVFALNKLYFLGLIFVALLMAYNQFLIKDSKRNLCFKAFLYNNYIGLAVTLAILIDIV